MDNDSLTLVRKYNQPVPRYTSYPTVPFWNNTPEAEQWKELVADVYARENYVNGISLYIHLPFCESLCTYCGCNKKITTNHSVENPYLEAVIQEWQFYRNLMSQTPVIRELHLGGGTPTFFSPENLSKLVEAITKRSILHPAHQFSIEGHPNNTTPEHLRSLSKLGFRRISFGVQDNNPEVQRVINRIQPFSNVQAGIENARQAGFESVNFDLIYGLPRQRKETIEKTINEVISLRPDRIAFYSYAHVPWASRGQRLFDENDLPSAEEKLELYRVGRELFLENGYVDIGMDHFALPDDELNQAYQTGKLHRNFMGYATQQSGVLIGLGVSAISDLGTAFGQNEKNLHDYYAAIENNRLPIKRGCILSDTDQVMRKYILDISCKGETYIREEDEATLATFTMPRLRELASDRLIHIDGDHIQVTATGRSFLRNICAAFDQYMNRTDDSNNMMFSKAV